MSTSRLVGAAGALTVAGILAVAVISHFEGLRTKAYLDSVSVPTICWGHTRGVRLGDEKTKEECKELLGEDLLKYEAYMVKCLDNPAAIPDKVYVATLSLVYNIGPGNFCKSSIRRYLNQGNYRAACNRFPVFNRAGGRPLKGLTYRRGEEKKLCLEGLSE